MIKYAVFDINYIRHKFHLGWLGARLLTAWGLDNPDTLRTASQYCRVLCDRLPPISGDASQRCRISQSYLPGGANGTGTGDLTLDVSIVTQAGDIPDRCVGRVISGVFGCLCMSAL